MPRRRPSAIGGTCCWSLIYCKGPEGEQLEFVQVLGHAKQVFDGGSDIRRRMLATRP